MELILLLPQFTEDDTEALTDEMTCPGDSAGGKRTPAAWLPASVPLCCHHELLGRLFCFSHYSYLQNERGKQIQSSGRVLPARSSSILNTCSSNVFEEKYINTHYFFLASNTGISLKSISLFIVSFVTCQGTNCF